MLTTTGRSMFHVTFSNYLILFWFVCCRFPDFTLFVSNAWKYLGSNAWTDSHNAPSMLCLKMREADSVY